MKIQKIFTTLLVVLGFSTGVFSQKSNVFYTQFSATNSSPSMNYERKFGTYHDPTGYYNFYGHLGIGKMSSQEVIATKVIKGTTTPNDPFTGNDPLGLLLYIFLNLVPNTGTPDQTLTQLQYFDVTNYNIGGKILLGKGKLNGIVGLDVRYDRINQRIEAWGNVAEQTKNYGKTFLSPSVGLRLNSGYFMTQLILAPQTTYGIKSNTDGVIYLGVGLQF